MSKLAIARDVAALVACGSFAWLMWVGVQNTQHPWRVVGEKKIEMPGMRTNTSFDFYPGAYWVKLVNGSAYQWVEVTAEQYTKAVEGQEMRVP